MVRKLADPNVLFIRSLPKEERDMMISTINSWIMSYGNVSSLPGWLSDALCRLSTGGGLSTRALYTDNDEMLFDARRPILLDGITKFVKKEDLIDRAIFLNFLAIPEDKRMTEAVFWDAFDKDYPLILGACFDTVARAMEIMPDIHLKSLPRMADFAVLGEAVGRAIGLEPGRFLEIYRGNRMAANDASLENSKVAFAIRKYIQEYPDASCTQDDPWTGTSSDLLGALNVVADETTKASKQWPRTPKGMSTALRRLAPQLRLVGVQIDFEDRTKKTRPMSIWRESEGCEPSPASPPSPSSEPESTWSGFSVTDDDG